MLSNIWIYVILYRSDANSNCCGNFNELITKNDSSAWSVKMRWGRPSNFISRGSYFN